MASSAPATIARMNPSRRLCLRLLPALAVAASLAAPAAARAEPAVGVVGGSVLAGFDTAAPGTFTSLRPISGLAPRERVQGLDFRYTIPASVQPGPLPQLFALGVTPGDALQLYTIDPGTAVATKVGSTPVPATAGAGYGFDFNPAVDRVRVVNSSDLNLRLNPNSGLLAGSDTSIIPGGRQVSGVAYDRVNVAPTVPPSPTTLYAIGGAFSELATIGGIDGLPSPNTGLYTAVGPLGITLDPGTTTDLDITFGGAALATLTSGGTQALYRIDLSTGAAALVGATAAPLSAFAVIPSTTLAFGSASYAAAESAGSVAVTAVRSGSLSPSTTVAWSASNGPQGTVAFAPGEAGKSFAVPIAADRIDEPDETAMLTLSSPSFPAALGGPATAVLTIADDDPAPDRGAPGVRLTGFPRSISYARLLQRGLRGTVTPSEAVAIEATLQGTVRRARLSAFNMALASRTLPLAPGARRVTLRPARSALQRPRRSVRIRVSVVAVDAAGNRSRVRRTVRLRRS